MIVIDNNFKNIVILLLWCLTRREEQQQCRDDGARRFRRVDQHFFSNFFSLFNDLHAPQLASHLKHTHTITYNPIHTYTYVRRAHTHVAHAHAHAHKSISHSYRYPNSSDEGPRKYSVKCVSHMCRARLAHVCIGRWPFTHAGPVVRMVFSRLYDLLLLLLLYYDCRV